jgi:anhydro-N-acetylmuramic acid kinase
MAESYEILGLMSGSSLDGLDLAWCRFERDKKGEPFRFSILASECHPFPEELQKALLRCRELSGLELTETDHAFATFCASAVAQLCRKSGKKPLAIASHGHTVFHHPAAGYTLQIGNGGLLSGLSGLPVISDFRTLDIGLGGQGAPLVPGAEAELFSEYQASLNLGGICNVSFPGKNTTGFDIGPCNQLLNFMSRKLGYDYDENGRLAASGKLLPDLLEQLNQLAYYRQPPPKSLSNEMVAETWIPLLETQPGKPEDVLNTLCRHIASQIAASLSGEGRILLSGGGAFNTFLTEQIRQQPGSGWQIELADAQLAAIKEALCFAWLGLKRLLEEENVPSSVTGAKTNSISGALYGLNPIRAGR